MVCGEKQDSSPLLMNHQSALLQQCVLIREKFTDTSYDLYDNAITDKKKNLRTRTFGISPTDFQQGQAAEMFSF